MFKYRVDGSITDKGHNESYNTLRRVNIRSGGGLLKEIKKESQEIVPYKTGNLRSAAHYSVRRNPISVTGMFWYDEEKAPYAMVQHETPDPPWSHSGGRRWHYWSDPINSREQDIEDIWRECFEGVWG
jgi:hypothetical protein